MRRSLLALLLAAPAAALGVGGGLYWRLSNPAQDRAPLPAALIDLDSPEGRALRGQAAATADLEPLLSVFQVQEKASWCGVASQAMALSLARGRAVAQAEVFTEEAEAVRSWWSVTFGGMPLRDLGGMLAANGLRADVRHAGDETLESFRASAARNLATPGDVVLVNYSRAALGQGDTGHISPLGAYDAASDRFLVLDVAAYRWPPVWVEARSLFAAMDTIDADGGKTRGFVLVAPAR